MEINETVQLIFNMMGMLGFFFGAYAALFKKRITISDIVKQINDLQLKR